MFMLFFSALQISGSVITASNSQKSMCMGMLFFSTCRSITAFFYKIDRINISLVIYIFNTASICGNNNLLCIRFCSVQREIMILLHLIITCFRSGQSLPLFEFHITIVIIICILLPVRDSILYHCRIPFCIKILILTKNFTKSKLLTIRLIYIPSIKRISLSFWDLVILRRISCQYIYRFYRCSTHRMIIQPTCFFYNRIKSYIIILYNKRSFRLRPSCYSRPSN